MIGILNELVNNRPILLTGIWYGLPITIILIVLFSSGLISWSLMSSSAISSMIKASHLVSLLLSCDFVRIASSQHSSFYVFTYNLCCPCCF